MPKQRCGSPQGSISAMRWPLAARTARAEPRQHAARRRRDDRGADLAEDVARVHPLGDLAPRAKAPRLRGVERHERRPVSRGAGRCGATGSRRIGDDDVGAPSSHLRRLHADGENLAEQGRP
jgi:hypothetical protein